MVDIKVRTNFPRSAREVEKSWIPMRDGVNLTARIWLPEDAETDPVPAIPEYLPNWKRDGTGRTRSPGTSLFCRPRLRRGER